jgi:hypothetical protein
MASHKFKKIIVHVGQDKTGTTHIQNTLFNNARKLKVHGILYPSVGISAKAHHALSGKIIDLSEAERPRHVLLGTTQDAAHILKEIEESDPMETLILSSESLGNIVEKNMEGFQKFDSYLRDFSSNVRYVAYVRDPVERFPSLTSQAFMRIATVPIIDRAINVANLMAFKELFGERFSLRVYDRAKFEAGDVLADFLKTVTDYTPLFNELEKAVHANRSLSAEGMYILQTIAFIHQMRNPTSFPNHCEEVQEIARLIRVTSASIPMRGSARVHDHIALAIRSACSEKIDSLNRSFGIIFKNKDDTHITDQSGTQTRSQLVKSYFKVSPELVEVEVNHLRSLKRTPENLRTLLAAVV